MRPDLWWYIKKQIRNVFTDLKQRLQRVDIRAMAADWAVTGVDVSYWQGEIKDPEKLAGMVDFVILRAGYGNDFIDPRLEEYRQFCIAYKVPFGLYWYAKPGKDFSKHALNFFSVWEDNPGKISPVFDLEESGGLSKSALDSWLKKMYDAFNSLAGRAYDDDLTYTSPGFLNKALGLTNWLKHTLLVVAHWTTAAQPIIPNEWAVPGFTWRFWQWSATGKGSDYGVSSRYIDLQRYNGSKAQFFAEFGINPPPPQEQDMKYKVVEEGLKIRSTPSVGGAIVGTRQVGDIVIPLKTAGDKAYPGAYWAQDAMGWSAVQYYADNRYLMEPFV